MKRKWSGLCLVAVVLLSGCTEEAVEPVVGTEDVSLVVTREATGEVVIEDRTHFYLDFEAEVEEVFVKEGDVVSTGDVLMTLDLSAYNTLLKQKMNEQTMYELDLKGLENNQGVEQTLINDLVRKIEKETLILQDESSSEFKMIEANRVLLESEKASLLADYKALVVLFEIGGVAKSELEDYELSIATIDKNIVDLTLQKEALIETKQTLIDSMKLEQTQLELQQANSNADRAVAKEKLIVQLETTKLQREALEEKLNKPYLNGNQVIAIEDHVMVYDLSIEKGTKTEMMQIPAFKTMPMGEKVIIADIPEAYSDELTIGQKVTIIPYTDESKTIEGTVIRMSEQATEQYGEIIVETTIEMDNEADGLKVGSSVDIIF